MRKTIGGDRPADARPARSRRPGHLDPDNLVSRARLARVRRREIALWFGDGLPEHAEANRANWTRNNAEYADADAESKWAREDMVWG